MALGQQYCRQIEKHLSGLHANFPPNRPLALGDYGVKRDDVFQRMGNIRQLGVAFKSIDGPADSSIQFKSSGSVNVEFIAKGEARPGGVPALRAALEIKFTRADAVFFAAAGCTMLQFDDVPAVGAVLADLLRQGRWDTEFYVVSGLVKAARTTAIVSADRSSEVNLEADSDVVPRVDIADAGVKLGVKRSRGTALEIVTANDQTPLMQLSRLRGVFDKVFRPEAMAAQAVSPFVFTPDDDLVDAVLARRGRDDERAVSESAGPAGEEAARPDEFRFEAAPSDFEVGRAIDAYIPLLEACYALAHQQPVAIPSGYRVLSEIRVGTAEAAEDLPGLQPEAQAAVRHDMEAMEAVADPEAFGFVVREDATGAVLVCIRGTQTQQEWLHNFTAVPNPFSLVPGFGLVHLGFERMYGRVRASIRTAVAAVGDVRITVIGHSLGGAMATLCAVDLKRNMGKTQVDLCTVGGPRVGKVGFRRNFNQEIPVAYRVTNQFDVVPHVPSAVTAWNHVGEEVEVDGQVDNPHSLKAYLAGLRRLGQPRELAPAGLAVPESMAAGGGVVSLRVP